MYQATDRLTLLFTCQFVFVIKKNICLVTIFFQELSKIFNNNNIDQYGRNEDKVLKCTNIPSDIDSIHNRRPKPSFGDI